MVEILVQSRWKIDLPQKSDPSIQVIDFLTHDMKSLFPIKIAYPLLHPHDAISKQRYKVNKE